ncbi:hypothetical protein LAZ67_6001291 [Cordylochernes scorpioides]|uniref:Metalloendopeptidase n=1 Tax=Cordylochernes scorpioides TaxID=51811 RepID=A0ABY6KJS1_9ARAC|nr:hypothetical protein LAZ67_6001291 [Cordylochernes scorpioides]
MSYTTDDKNMKKMLHAGHNRCYSSWGRDGGRQIVSLGEGCESFGIILHELNHAVGFEHEHSRSDRDDHIEVLWDSIDEGRCQYWLFNANVELISDAFDQFEKFEPHDNKLLTPFDFDSIMLYGPKDFSKNDCPTIRAKSGITIIDVADKTVLSKGDIERINKLYEYGSGKNSMIKPHRFQGDMVGKNVQKHQQERNAIAEDDWKWPRGVIPYVLSRKVKHIKKNILKAMKYFKKNTCIRFVPRKKQKDYIYIDAKDGCYSSWGRDGGRQIVSLGEGCESFGIILHELNHAVGFEHEHSRSDRDDHIEVLWDSIDEGEKDQFEKFEPHDNKLLTPFDFDSIMLYGPKVFSKNDCPTIRAKSGITIIDVADKTVLSKGDIERINKLYEC